MWLAGCAPQRSGRSTPAHTKQRAPAQSTTSAVAPRQQPAAPTHRAFPLGESPVCLAGCARAHTPAKNSRKYSLDSWCVRLPQSWLRNPCDTSSFRRSLGIDCSVDGVAFRSGRCRAGVRLQILVTEAGSRAFESGLSAYWNLN